jgi:cysteine desulfurase family protein (TIGR01976 family)
VRKVAKGQELMSSIDPHKIRPRFPALAREQDGQPVLFFDNPATTQVPRETIDGITRYLSRSNANVGGLFATSRETDRMLNDAREAMGAFLGASAGEVVFGPNMTTLTFALSHVLGRVLKSGDEVVTTGLEHDANIAPWLALEERGITVKFIDINVDDMTLDLASAEEVLSARTRLLAVGYASNVFGTINPVKHLIEMAHAHGAWVFVDAVHYAPHGSIDVQTLDCDFLACSPYKFFGPHLGVLYGRKELLDDLPSYHVRPAGDMSPDKWETGTQTHELLAGLIGTIEYLASLGEEDECRRARLVNAMGRIRAYERTLSEHLVSGIVCIPGVRVYGITDPKELDRRVPTISFTVAGREPLQVAEALGKRGIFSWAGDHYAVEPLARAGITATNRIGLVHYNTHDEIDQFLNALEDVAE